MLDFVQIKQFLQQAGLSTWAEQIEAQLTTVLLTKPHGDMPRWQTLLKQLPAITTDTLTLNQGLIQLGDVPEIATQQQLETVLQQFHPWRKGPFLLHGVHINTEWRSDWKWDRLLPHIEPLAGRRVLDIGCGNGYHCWRMAGEEADYVVGIDPTLLFFMQFQAIRQLLVQSGHPVVNRVQHLPLSVEAVPAHLHSFDSVFSMGVLYHRRSPIEHLQKLQGMLRPGGQLVLETLVIEGEQVLIPQGRYAKMRNVWCIPGVEKLENWLYRCGYQDIRTVDVAITTTQEQRATGWMRFESLADFLDPDDVTLTLEGYPAPKRAITLAIAP